MTGRRLTRTSRGVYLSPSESPHRVTKFGMTFIFPSQKRMEVWESKSENEFSRVLSKIYSISSITGFEFTSDDIINMEKSTYLKIYADREVWDIVCEDSTD